MPNTLSNNYKPKQIKRRDNSHDKQYALRENAKHHGMFGSGCVFQLTPITYFSPNRSPVSIQTDHLFQ